MTSTLAVSADTRVLLSMSELALVRCCHCLSYNRLACGCAPRTVVASIGRIMPKWVLVLLAALVVLALLAWARIDKVDAIPDDHGAAVSEGRVYLLVGSDSREGANATDGSGWCESCTSTAPIPTSATSASASEPLASRTTPRLPSTSVIG